MRHKVEFTLVALLGSIPISVNEEELSGLAFLGLPEAGPSEPVPTLLSTFFGEETGTPTVTYVYELISNDPITNADGYIGDVRNELAEQLDVSPGDISIN